MSSEIREFFEQYADRYMAGDAETVADMYTAPFLAVRHGTPIYLPDRPSVVEHLAGLMSTYARSGAAVAEITDIDLLEQGDSATLVTVHWNVRSAGGEMIRDFRTSYQLAGRPSRIVSYVNHDVVGAT
jgi:ketosteroid isomerase-like protein